jgi:hypothetical protein
LFFEFCDTLLKKGHCLCYCSEAFDLCTQVFDDFMAFSQVIRQVVVV